MDWRPAKCLLTLREQVDGLFPGRDKSSDGILGDARHAATKSEHNPDANGVVRAMDISHDPAHGLNARALAEALVASHDKRIKYLISNRQIISSEKEPWTWRPYSGTNAHEHHMHISVVEDPRLYDDEHRWNFEMTAPAPPPVEALRTFANITATVFGGVGDEQPVAYPDVNPGWPDRPGVALPYHFSGLPRRLVRVTSAANGKSADCEIVDVGPWYPSQRGPGDPYWLTNSRPRAETDPNTNKAGIDLTPAAARAIGIDGKGLVNWGFVSPATTTPQPKGTPVTTPVAGFKLPFGVINDFIASAQKFTGTAEFAAPLVSTFLPQLAPLFSQADELKPGLAILELLSHLEETRENLDGDAETLAMAAAAEAWAAKQRASIKQPVDVQGRSSG